MKALRPKITAVSVRKSIKMADKFVKKCFLLQKNKWRPVEYASQWAPSIKLESVEILCVESIHGRSIKLENQVESIQRPGYHVNFAAFRNSFFTSESATDHGFPSLVSDGRGEGLEVEYRIEACPGRQ